MYYRRCRSVVWLPLLVVGSCLMAGPLQAQEIRYVPDKPVTAPKVDLGWDGKLTVGASTTVSQSTNVVGRIDGTSFSFGAKVNGALDYLRGVHEWRNSLLIGEMFTIAPPIDKPVKTNDQLSFDSLYLYHLRRLPWLGPFARFQLLTPVFVGVDYRETPVTYVDKADPTVLIKGPSRSLRLSDPFRPLTLLESLGAFGKPINRTAVSIEIKVGAQARQTFADGQYAIADDSATPEIEVSRLSTLIQGGPAAGVIARGTLSEGKVLYNAVAEAMMPVLNDKPADDKRNAAELTNVNLEANLSFKLVSWASLDYQFKAVREPQLLNKWQIQNNLLLTFAYTFVKSQQPPPPAK